MRARLILIMVGVVALILIAHDIPLAFHLERVERDRLVTRYERDAFMIAGRSEEELDDGTAAESVALAQLVDGYAAAANVEVVVVDVAGSAVVTSDKTKSGSDMTNRSEISQVLDSGTPVVGRRYSNTLAADLFVVTVPVISGSETVGVVRISVPSQLVSDRVDEQVRGLALVALISILIAVFVAWVVARGLSGPIRRLRETTNRLAAGDLTTRAVRGDGPSEVDALAASFNAMADRIEHLVARQRAFAGDASHQLRTPLTALRLRLEQLETTTNSEAERDAVESAVEETERLGRMVEGLLALSRAEDQDAEIVSVNASIVAAERVEAWEALAAENGVVVTSHVADNMLVQVVPGGLEQVLDNLIDNALEVSPAGGSVEVDVADRGNAVELRVIDEGPGMSTEERSLAFERFWRSKRAAKGGTGLGLAIVQQLVDASGGRVELREAATGGIEAVVTLVKSTPDRSGAVHAGLEHTTT